MLVAVLDTNALLSGLLGGVPRQLLDALFADRFRLAISRVLIEEFTDVLHRPQWRRLLHSPEYRALLALMRHDALIVTPTDIPTICRDIDDNELIACALAGRADVLVTGDKDLLVLGPSFHGIRLLRPAEFLQRLA